MARQKRIKSEVMSSMDIKRGLTRIAHEILEKNHGSEDLVLVGIRTRGVFLAERIAAIIEEFEGTKVDVGILDITLYRDDIAAMGANPIVRESQVPFDLTGKKLCW